MAESPEVSVILPCRNEEQALGVCLKQILDVTSTHDIDAEIIVSDSSSDSSPHIAKQFGVRLVKHDREGYGRAYQEGYAAACGQILFGADPDGQYDFREIPRFLKEMRSGADMVIGNRLVPELSRDVMPWLHRHVGSPVLRQLTALRFGGGVYDTQCGMRAITRESLDKLSLSTSGMEYASEMIVQALRHKLRIVQIPISYHPRLGSSKLRTWRDGWRHVSYLVRASHEDRNRSQLPR